MASGIDPTRFNLLSDFGPGFYTTTNLEQAINWARNKGAPGDRSAAVVSYSVDRNELGRLRTLAFVRGDANAVSFWSLVQHCRDGRGAHGLGGDSRAFYDVVYGPVAAVWSSTPYRAHPLYDQISFHTPAAWALLRNPTSITSV
jgi:Protein of unknown function (DUF3990)